MIKVHLFVRRQRRLRSFGDVLLNEGNFYFVRPSCEPLSHCLNSIRLPNSPTVEASGKGKAKLGLLARRLLARDQIRIAHEENFGEVFMGPRARVGRSGCYTVPKFDGNS